ncbi:MAG: alpha/beta hydrolase, partial [Microthrixaceae bacterium]
PYPCSLHDARSFAMVDVIPGAEAWSHDGGPIGVLVLHGFTGNPSSVRGLAEAFAEAGHSVEMPRLPGHGTSMDDLLDKTWQDWSGEATEALARLAARTETQFVAGQSLGGSLTCWLAVRHPELAGLICVNPAVVPSDDMRTLVAQMIEAGDSVIPGIGSDISQPGVTESAYEDTPLAPLLSLFDASAEFGEELGSISQPLLLFTSPEDHVVPPSDSDTLADAVSGPVERVSCSRSYHVATQDYDKELIFERSVEFVERVAASD